MVSSMNMLLRQLPSVDICLNAIFKEDTTLYTVTPRFLLRELINTFFDRLREDIKSGNITDSSFLTLDYILPQLLTFIKRHSSLNCCKVINATGVILHTNMGRSILPQEALQAINTICSGYSNLELNLKTGERGSRYSHVVGLLCKLTGAESAIVVNNNAAAVLLTLDTLCKGKEVIIARGQLVEIGGSFRIPDVMEHSGAKLKEVGCTNRVHLKDYEKAITVDTAAIMHVHTSNYRVIGFHSEVSLKDLVMLSSKHNLLCIEDLGSGSFIDFSQYGLLGEPTVQSVISAGVHIVTFSGDKVLGGPQAGIILGKKETIAQIASNPLNRALRIDKMTLVALESTLKLYLDKKQAVTRIPTLAMITISPESLEEKAKNILSNLKKICGEMIECSIVPGFSQVGGGAFPEYNLPTSLIYLHPTICSSEKLKMQLLDVSPPILGRIEKSAFCLDPRTIADTEIDLVITAISQAIDAINTINNK